MNVKRWTLTIFACALIVALLGGYKYLQIRKAITFAESFPETSVAVESVVAAYSDVQGYIETTGEIVAPQLLELRNEVAGRIETVNFVSGQRVEKGANLLQLDVAEERARLQAAKARAELARIELKRAEKLRIQRSISEEAVDTARSQYAVAKADIAALNAQIRKKTLRAPFDAMAGIHSLEPGQILQANTLISNLVGLQDYLWVDFYLPFERNEVTVGDRLQLGLRGQPEVHIDGEVIASESVISAASRSIRLRGKIPDHQALKHNASVDIKLPARKLRAVRLPANAVRRDTVGEFVYVLLSDSEGALRAYRRPVQLAGVESGVAMIKSGVDPGDRVATIGAFKLRENMLVKPHLADNPAESHDSGASTQRVQP
ncbi:MAG: efflux RND transporter periplasmic adaptor subunit [Gammaproteobacteria bacterium]|nr:efflux RND transporter periplasmic adaptor subunit [Gammaproteobacteria bacterium]NND40227.1 efflux RND transporter periplasmic adaptor subunit [Pseudomonadales bacterium]MBT8151897.1 efflux RND transporter periplasmic adaptor subunit [Gammaproteobacteria bacterium]NNL11113.1 efflux RND transporter periplasmic adaptor subunit [Pseudomonadales bacterium]NNM12467.1 efflux RND transporter periplasmic adaptor subunit [Pseudomonadales bacterium]